MPNDPESEDLLALAATAARSTAGFAHEPLTSEDPVATLTSADRPGGRSRPDRCPGVTRPWPADDGLLVRVRLVGGRIAHPALMDLLAVAEAYGDGALHLTGRANLQLRALPAVTGGDPSAPTALDPEVREAIQATGVLPSLPHELARNVLVSPATGLSGGRADLRPWAARLDAAMCADPLLAQLPGRFLFVLDDGRGDLLERPCDLGWVALDATTVQLRVGESWGPVVPLRHAVTYVLGLARSFLDTRGTGPGAAWHVRELATPLLRAQEPDPRLPSAAPPLPFGAVGVLAGVHDAVPDARLVRSQAERIRPLGDGHVVVTPWRGILGGAR